MTSLPEGWESDYDGSRWFFRYKPNGFVQYQFPKPGDEFPEIFDSFGMLKDDYVLTPEERLESERQVRRQTGASPTSTWKKSEEISPITDTMSATVFGHDFMKDVWNLPGSDHSEANTETLSKATRPESPGAETQIYYELPDPEALGGQHYASDPVGHISELLVEMLSPIHDESSPLSEEKPLSEFPVELPAIDLPAKKKDSIPVQPMPVELPHEPIQSPLSHTSATRRASQPATVPRSTTASPMQLTTVLRAATTSPEQPSATSSTTPYRPFRASSVPNEQVSTKRVSMPSDASTERRGTIRRQFTEDEEFAIPRKHLADVPDFLKPPQPRLAQLVSSRGVVVMAVQASTAAPSSTTVTSSRPSEKPTRPLSSNQRNTPTGLPSNLDRPRTQTMPSIPSNFAVPAGVAELDAVPKSSLVPRVQASAAAPAAPTAPALLAIRPTDPELMPRPLRVGGKPQPPKERPRSAVFAPPVLSANFSSAVLTQERARGSSGQQPAGGANWRHSVNYGVGWGNEWADGGFH